MLVGCLGGVAHCLPWVDNRPLRRPDCNDNINSGNFVNNIMFCPCLCIPGGYHPNCDVHDYWEELEETVQQAAPAVRWGRLPTFRLCYDDQFGKPFGETCRSSIGWVVSSGCVGEFRVLGFLGGGSAAHASIELPPSADPAAEAAAWRRHPLVAQHGLRVGIFPRCACFATELPHCGPMSHGVALARVLPLFMDLAREGRVSGLRC